MGQPVPQRIGADIVDDDGLAAIHRGAARTHLRPDLDPVDGPGETGRQARRGAVADMLAIGVEQQHRGHGARRGLLDARGHGAQDGAQILARGDLRQDLRLDLAHALFVQPFGDVARNNQACLAILELDRARHDFDIDFAAVLQSVPPLPRAMNIFVGVALLEVGFQSCPLLVGANIENGHREKFFAAVAIVFDRGVVDGEELERFRVEHPGRQRAGIEQQPEGRLVAFELAGLLVLGGHVGVHHHRTGVFRQRRGRHPEPALPALRVAARIDHFEAVLEPADDRPDALGAAMRVFGRLARGLRTGFEVIAPKTPEGSPPANSFHARLDSRILPAASSSTIST